MERIGNFRMMRLNKISFAVLVFLFCNPVFAAPKVDYASIFGQRQGCFILSDLSTGKIIEEYNAKRCGERFSPCSTFKIAAAVMGFEKSILKDENQVIKWDGIKRDRAELNQDQTPFTWMSNSAKWVTEWIMPQLGKKTIQNFLNAFKYGNEDFSGGLKDAWVTSSLKISAYEQVAFISKLWKNELPVSRRTSDLTQKIIFIKNLSPTTELYGKTGTGCITGHNCDKLPGGPMLGWFVGVVKSKAHSYVFAANASDTVADPKDRAGGPRLRDTVIDLIDKLGIEK